MPPFRTVHASRAGPSAVGILVPPGNRTLVVVRPRALAVDLVMARPGTNGCEFMDASRSVAGVEAQKLVQALASWADGGPGTMVAAPAPDGTGFWIRMEVAHFSLIACPRVGGEPYRPQVYGTAEEARHAADALCAVLCPAPEGNQELYTNLSQFGRV